MSIPVTSSSAVHVHNALPPFVNIEIALPADYAVHEEMEYFLEIALFERDAEGNFVL